VTLTEKVAAMSKRPRSGKSQPAKKSGAAYDVGAIAAWLVDGAARPRNPKTC